MDPLAIAPNESLLSPITLFLHADFIVKSVMLGLLAASIWTWAIIFGHGMAINKLIKRNEAFERDFSSAEDIDRFIAGKGRSDLPSAKVLTAGIAEWRRSTSSKPIDKEGTRTRLASVMTSVAGAEVDRLGDRLNILATIGSVSPFVGLFGTVWGIMKSFTDIAASQNTSLGVVAPGIAEALFATALGLFAAIPAVIAYNRLTHKMNRIEAGLHRFADSFHSTLSRELERTS